MDQYEWCFERPNLVISAIPSCWGNFNKDTIYISRCCLERTNVLASFKIEDIRNNINLIDEVGKIVDSVDRTIECNRYYLENKFMCPMPKRKDGKIRSVQLSLYSACNAKCEFCFSDKSLIPNKDIYLKTLYETKGKVCRIKLTDLGEPLLLLKDMKEFFKSLKPDDLEEIFINTNGILIDDELIEIMKNAPVNFSMNISLNATDRETYKKIVGVDAFDRVIENTKKIIDSGIAKPDPIMISFIYYEPLFGKLATLREDVVNILDGRERFNISLNANDNKEKYMTQEFKETKEKLYANWVK